MLAAGSVAYSSAMPGDDQDGVPIGESDALPWQESLTGREVGEFVIGEQIGEGGYGFIYRAQQKTLSREVVIKALRWKGGVANDDRNSALPP